ncbi:MAG: nitrate reductase molybdenum cofactor assembly chaperone [Streptosporangiaceae bacterium]
MTAPATTPDLAATGPATQPGKAAGYKLASILLQYPTQALFDGIDTLAAAARSGPGPARRHFMGFLDWLRATPPHEVAQHYVATFDLRRRSALYLTYYRHGDTRRRGMALLAFKNAYRAAGLEPAGEDLPDHLPVVLDFAAVAPQGETLLRRHRADLELLRRALRDDGTPYAHVIDAVCAQLPRLGRAEILRIRAAERKGPPAEDVGLEPFAPPGYLTGQEVSR